MKKNRLLIGLMFFLMAFSTAFFGGCETGTRYDKNTSIKTPPKQEAQSGLVNREDIEALLDDEEIEEEVVAQRSWIDIERDADQAEDVDEVVSSFSNGVVEKSLDVVKVREGRHEGYLRLVFDIYSNGKSAKKVGQYDAKYIRTQKDIVVTLHGYQKFSAPLPSFPHDSTIEQIYFEQYPANKGFKFHIKLREESKVRIFNLEKPARLVFDIKSI